MKYPTRIYYTQAGKSLMWDRWEKGESLNSIGRHFGRSHSSIQNILSQTGDITVRTKPLRLLGIERIVLRPVNWYRTRHRRV